MFVNFINLIQSRHEAIFDATVQHLEITFIALVLANLIAIPLGIFLTRHKKMASPVIGIVGIFQTIPSLALLGFMIPLMGIGYAPAITALTIYGLLPVLRNTYIGITGVNRAAVEAGRGMGMTSRQVLFMIELPMAMPVIMAGIRTATVLMIGVATLVAFIGAGGLGDLIFRGIATVNSELILAGAIPAALLAIAFDVSLQWLEKRLQPIKGTKGAQQTGEMIHKLAA